MNFTHTPVTTYYPTGHPDQSLPMGKYYPSNWENREHTRSGPSTVSRSSTPKSPSQKGSNSPKLSPSESEVRRLWQLQQYKRDMVTQIALATNDTIFHTPPHKGRGITVTGAGLPTISGSEVRFGASATPYRPASPRLLPLHSPGPVTPMELGSSSSGGDYIQSAPVAKDSSGSSPRTT
ncbi:hypothetical protein N3K66_000965 [Trichothecium roseum]|uniref:Uncharacterized protein n=1 Tax=Trichothecium roseum TaxID=47278 RepID=A0ACC0VD98_9HYPO|nr:hypothetical protein N3K66_000965 [Trichothecium roseum]